MADLIQNVQEVYKKWESRSISNRGRMKNRVSFRKQYHESDLSNFSRSLQQRRKESFKRVPYSNFYKYDNIAAFKMAPTVAPISKPRPFVGIPCAKCFPHSKAFIEEESIYLLGINNMLNFPYFSIQSFNICCLWNLFKIQSLPQDMPADILNTKRISDAIQDIYNADDQEECMHDSDTYESIKIIMRHLKSSISSFCLGFTGFFLHHVFKKIFDGIFINKGQIEILKILNKEDIPYVYLPLYRSYFDHILIPYILYMNSLPVPFSFIDDELFLPILGYIFRMLGAVYIKKSMILEESKSDLLYDVIVKHCIIKSLKANHCIKLNLETHPSFTGKPQMPKTNLFSIIVDAVANGSVEDVYVVPVSIMYETTNRSLISKQLQSNSKRDSSIFSKLYYIWKIIHLKYGNARINFNQPFSIKEFLETCKKKSDLNFDCSLSPIIDLSFIDKKDKENNEIRTAVNNLSLHTFYDSTTCSSVMGTHLLAFLLVTQYRKGGTQQQLQNSMDWLRKEILKKKYDVGFTGESLPVIKRAVELLGKDLISIETIEMEWTSSDLENNNVKIRLYNPVVKLPHILELQYYANAVVPIFFKESLLVNALYALIDVDICHFHHCDSRFYISRDGLIQRAIKLSQFLKYEFITVLPCEDIVSIFNDTIDALIEKECLSGANVTEGFIKASKKSRALAFDGSSDEDQCNEVIEQQLKIDLREESISHLEFLRSILSPYIESYWLAACSLLKLIDEVKEESVFIQEMQTTAKEKLYKGLLAYEESFSAETLKNSLKMFADRQIIEYDSEDSVTTLCLSEFYNSFECVNDIIADIEDFRK